MTEVGKGNEAIPSGVPSTTAVTDPMIQRRWNTTAMTQLVDSEGLGVDGGYDYEITYGSAINPDPTFNRVEGGMPVGEGNASLGAFVLARRNFGASVTGYNFNLEMPTDTTSGTGTVTIYRPDGATATIRFTVSVKDGKPTISPESTKLAWSPKK